MWMESKPAIITVANVLVTQSGRYCSTQDPGVTEGHGSSLRNNGIGEVLSVCMLEKGGFPGF